MARAPLFASATLLAERIAGQAAGVPLDLVGMSTLSGAHLDTVPALLDALAARAIDVPVVVGGIVPDAHASRLMAAGVRAVFGPGTPMEALAVQLAEMVERSLAAACATDAAPGSRDA